MRTVWSASFELSVNSLDKCKTILAEWLRSPQKEPTFSGAFLVGTTRFDSGGLLDIEESESDPTAWALRYERPVPMQGLIWITEVSLAVRASRLHGAARLSQRSLQSGRPKFERVLLRPPGFILEMRRQGLFGAHGYKLGNANEENAPYFVQALLDSQRKQPIVAVSVEPYSEKPLLDAKELQDELIGVAQVIVVSKQTSVILPSLLESLGVASEDAKRWGVYGGAVKVYRPQAKPTDNPFEHPLWLPRDVAAAGFAAAIKDWCWSLATLQTPSDLPDVATLRGERRSRALAIQQPATTESVDELTELYDGLLKEEERRTAEQRDRAENEKIRADELAGEVRALEAKVQALFYQLEQKNAGQVGSLGDEEIVSVRQAIDRGRRAFVDTLIIPDAVDAETSLGGKFWFSVFQALNDLCLRERKGEAKNKRVLLRDLLNQQIGMPKDTYKVADTDVHMVNPETGSTVHLRERVHLREGRPAETESIYWGTVGSSQTEFKYLIGKIGRHVA